MDNRLTLAQTLINHHRDKAVELLMDCLRDEKTRKSTEQYLGRQIPSPQWRETAPEQQPRSSRARSHHLDSYTLQRTARQNTSDAQHHMHTPPHSTSSVKSYPSSLAAEGLEKIYLMSCEESGADQPVMSRSAAVKHHLIRDTVVSSRGLRRNVVSVNERVYVPCRSGDQKPIVATAAVNLTWRYRGGLTSNLDTFYIVPIGWLDSDVVLGSDDSIESIERQSPSEVQASHSLQAHYQGGGFVEIEELDPAVPPHSPSVAPILQRTQDFVRDNQRMHVAEQSAPAPHARHVDHEQPSHTSTPLAAKRPSSDKLHIMGTWDKTPLQMSFDPGAPGEAFYQAFHQWAVRRNRDGGLERDRMTLLLKISKNTPDDEAYELQLKEGDFEQLWEMAVDWIQDNKSPKAPHLYATVRLDAG